MPTAWQRIISKFDSTLVNALNGVEIVYTTITVTDMAADSVVRIVWIVDHQPGASVTTVTPRIRFGGVAGTALGVTTALTVTAATSRTDIVSAEHTPGEITAQTYSLTMLSTGGTTAQGYSHVFAIVG